MIGLFVEEAARMNREDLLHYCKTYIKEFEAQEALRRFKQNSSYFMRKEGDPLIIKRDLLAGKYVLGCDKTSGTDVTLAYLTGCLLNPDTWKYPEQTPWFLKPMTEDTEDVCV
jgi:hypothetical protein